MELMELLLWQWRRRHAGTGGGVYSVRGGCQGLLAAGAAAERRGQQLRTGAGDGAGVRAS
jgi:hypothetical protein